MVPNHEKKGDYYVNMCLSQSINEFFLKKVGRDVFHKKQKHQCHLPSKENEFMVPNHEKKENYYINSCLPQKMDLNLTLKNGRKISLSCETKASMSFATMRRMSLWSLIMKKMEIIM